MTGMTDDQARYELAVDAALEAGKTTVNELADAEEAGEQVSIRELLERMGDASGAEILTPERIEEKKNAHEIMMQPFKEWAASEGYSSWQELLEELRRRSEAWQPFKQLVIDNYPDDHPLMESPVWSVTVGIEYYFELHDLDEATQEERAKHLPDFLVFFANYLQALEAVKGPLESMGPDITEDELLQVWEALEKAGIIPRRTVVHRTKRIYPQELSAPPAAIRYPAELLMALDKVSSNTWGSDKLLQPTPIPVNVHAKNSKKEIQAFAWIDKDKLNEISEMLDADGGLTLFDRAVYNAVASLYEEGNRVITLRAISRTMRRNKKARMTDAQEKEINDAITKLMYVPCTIDATEVAKAYRYHGDSVIQDGPLLNAERTVVKIGGETTTAIRVFSMPALFKFAGILNQIARWPMASLATPIDKTPLAIVIQEELMRKISAMRGSPKYSRTIRYQSLYDLQGGSLDRTQKARIRKTVTDILKDWIKNGEIKAFKEMKKGQTLHGITIVLAETKK